MTYLTVFNNLVFSVIFHHFFSKKSLIWNCVFRCEPGISRRWCCVSSPCRWATLSRSPRSPPPPEATIVATRRWSASTGRRSRPWWRRTRRQCRCPSSASTPCGRWWSRRRPPWPPPSARPTAPSSRASWWPRSRRRCRSKSRPSPRCRPRRRPCRLRRPSPCRRPISSGRRWGRCRWKLPPARPTPGISWWTPSRTLAAGATLEGWVFYFHLTIHHKVIIISFTIKMLHLYNLDSIFCYLFLGSVKCEKPEI